MDKRYQVFVSSTFTDLKDERQRVIQTLMEMDCIPAGMELFSAMDEEQMAFIRKVIDDCDYYLLIIGGRYGSMTEEGISYTEQEYDYAVSLKMKVIALLHEKPDEIPLSKSEASPELREKLEKFRQKVLTGRIVKFWNDVSDLPGLVSLGLSRTIKTYPAVGWVRANTIANTEVLTQINQLRLENQQLRETLTKTTPTQYDSITNIASLDEVFVVHGGNSTNVGNGFSNWKAELTWHQIFSSFAPSIMLALPEYSAKDALCASIISLCKPAGFSFYIDDQDFQTIGIQFRVLGLITIKPLGDDVSKAARLYWSLTPKGEQVMLEARVVRSGTQLYPLILKKGLHI